MTLGRQQNERQGKALIRYGRMLGRAFGCSGRSKPATAHGNMCVLMGKRSRCRSIYPYPRWTRVPWASKGRCGAAENHRAHASVHGECGRFW